MNKKELNRKKNVKHILVIDDDRDEQELLVTAFLEESPEYRVICLDNGKSGLYYLRQLNEAELPCLIVLDYNLPGWNGADVLFNLQQIPRLKHIPVIIYSNSGNLHAHTMQGARAFVQKAGTWQGIKDNIKSFLMYGQDIPIS
jgi:CheY-like chemotaxis protein